MLTDTRLTIAALCALPALLSACESSTSTAAGAASASSTAASRPKPTASASPQPVKKQEALAVERLSKALRCAANSQGGPCVVLNDFKDCKPHKLVTPGGEGRWIGQGYRVTAGKYIDEYTLMRARRVPSTEVGSGQIPAKIAVSKIPDEESAALNHAGKAIRKLARDDIPKPNNAAMLYLKRLQDWSESYASLAEDNQVYLVVDDGMYLCQHQQHQRLLLIARSTNGKSPADGLYAELYPTTW